MKQEYGACCFGFNRLSLPTDQRTRLETNTYREAQRTGVGLDQVEQRECYVVGPRSSEFSGLRLPGYAVSTGGLLFTLGDATITIRLRNLENRSPLEPWLDTSSVQGNRLGTEALGPGREIRFAMTLNLLN